MARLNIEDRFFLEVAAVAKRIGGDLDRATGNALNFLRYAQETHKAGRLISETDFEAMGFLPELIPLFAIKTDEGIKAAGAEKFFGWLEQKTEAGRVGGSVSSEAKRLAAQTREANKRKSTSEPQATTSETTKPQASSSSSSSLSPSIEVEEEQISETEKTGDVFRPKTATEAFDGMLDSRRKIWSELYDDPKYVQRTIMRAFAYYSIDHPAEQPTSRRGWSKAFGYWLEKDWAAHRRERSQGAPLRHIRNHSSGTDWESEATKLFTDIKRFGPYDDDERKKSILGERWTWISRTGLLSKARTMPENDWSRKQLARDMKEAYEKFGTTSEAGAS